jgi:hypothetical protein
MSLFLICSWIKCEARSQWSDQAAVCNYTFKSYMQYRIVKISSIFCNKNVNKMNSWMSIHYMSGIISFFHFLTYWKLMGRNILKNFLYNLILRLLVKKGLAHHLLTSGWYSNNTALLFWGYVVWILAQVSAVLTEFLWFSCFSSWMSR